MNPFEILSDSAQEIPDPSDDLSHTVGDYLLRHNSEARLAIDMYNSGLYSLEFIEYITGEDLVSLINDRELVDEGAPWNSR